MIKFRDGMFGPTLILLAICIIVTGALALTQVKTADKIKESELAAAVAIRSVVLQKANGDFEKIEGIDLPEGVMEAYKATNGTGYVFKAGSKGFGGLVTFMVAVDADGNYVGINMFEHTETPGLGSKIGAEAYISKYYGNSDYGSVDGITGATITTNALKNTLAACNEAYQMIKEA